MKACEIENVEQFLSNQALPLSTAQAAVYLGISVRLLEELRRAGGGPDFFGSGRVKYRKAALDAWMPGGATEWLSSKEALPLLNVSKRTMEDWRKKNVGPTWKMFAKRTLRYHRPGLTEHRVKAATHSC